MRMWRYKVLLPVFAFFMFLVACLGANVSAEDEVISIGISSDSVVMNLMPGQFDEGTQTITAQTTSEAGYTIKMRATGESSALTEVDDSNYTIPTFALPVGNESIPADELGGGYGYSIDGGAN